MPKVAVVTPDKARCGSPPVGMSCDGQTSTYLEGARHPLHLHLHRLSQGASLCIGPRDIDCLAYVWEGAVDAGGHRLARGSSLIVEHGESLAVTAEAGGAVLLTFTAGSLPSGQRAGGHVHLLPADRVPRSEDLGSSGVGGGMHFDSACPSCEIWLHENHFPPSEPLPPEKEALGVHCHSEDEIIFVTSGTMRLGGKLVGRGTALAIAADTMYSFTPGPDGLSFINFRAGTPGDIRFANGMTVSETGYWRERLPRPDYLAPAA